MTQEQKTAAFDAHSKALDLLFSMRWNLSDDAYNAHMSSLCAAHLSGDYAQDFGKPMPVTDKTQQDANK